MQHQGQARPTDINTFEAQPRGGRGTCMRTTVEVIGRLIRLHEWTPLELLVVGVLTCVLGCVGIDVAAVAWHQARERWRRRRVRLVSTGEPHGYADPARHHRHAVRAVGGVATTAASGALAAASAGCSLGPDPRPARVSLPGIVEYAAEVQRDIHRAAGAGQGDPLGRAAGLHRGAPRIVRCGAHAGYGQSTTLVLVSAHRVTGDGR